LEAITPVPGCSEFVSSMLKEHPEIFSVGNNKYIFLNMQKTTLVSKLLQLPSNVRVSRSIK
jgi:hypothetical protein